MGTSAAVEKYSLVSSAAPYSPYDASGNTLRNSTDTDTYNDAGRLKTVTNTSGTTTFIYNGLGQMIEASGSSGIILYAYGQAGHLLGEYDGAGNLIQETVWLGDIPVATLRPSGSSVAIYYVVTDQLDTPREVIMPSDNAVMWSWFSGPFGSDAPNTNPQGAGAFTYDLRFPGQIAGTWGSTYQNNARDYDSAVGRYIESDPVGLRSGVNTYAYVLGNPLSYFDQFGLDVEVCSQPAFGWMPIDHQWIKTDSVEAGMGGTKGNIPGNQSGDLPYDPVQVTNHAGRSLEKSASCRVVHNIDEKKVDQLLQIGRPLGRWTPFNQCHSFVRDTLDSARYYGATGSWGDTGATGSW